MSHATTHGDGKHSMRAVLVTVFLVLGFLTVLELYVPSMYSAAWNGHTKMILLTLLASAKALLVAYYFMHLRWEKPWLRYIAAMPLYMGAAVIIIMLETVYR